MNVEAKLKELLDLTAEPNASSDNQNWTGEVGLENLSEPLKAFIQQNQQVEIKLPDFKNVHTTSKDAGSIPAFLKIVDDVMVGNNVFLVGEAGTGKTYLAESISKALDRPHITINCNQWTSPREIIGGETIEGYKEGKLVDAWAKGKILILDELPKLDANTAGLLNEALAKTDAEGDNAMITTGEGRKVKKHKAFGVIATGNTTGKRTSSKYGGNNKQDASLIDRFSSSYYYIEFNRELEKSLIFETVFSICDQMRDVLIKQEASDIITLRTMKQINKIYYLEMEREVGNLKKVKGGKTLKDAIESYLSIVDKDIADIIRKEVSLREFLNTYKGKEAKAVYLKDRKRFTKS